MDIQIVYEDEAIVVVDKPRGVVSNRATTVRETTVQDWMEERYHISSNLAKSEAERYFVERVGLVHRLDRATSGLLVLAKKWEAFDELLRQFREREIEKVYLALTHGIWKSREGEINLGVGRRRDNRQRMGVREDGRESVTAYRVLKEYKSLTFPKDLGVRDKGYSGFSLVEFAPKTGRMHQIRVHSKTLGHPVVGDTLYAGRKRSREDLKWAGGLMLLAKQLTLTHPASGKRLTFVCPRELMDVTQGMLGVLR